MEKSIFQIIKKEKKNINSVNLSNVNRLFSKYYFKYILDIKDNFIQIDNNIFSREVSKISNMLFNIFWIIFLISFNIHITIFFLERASLLCIEYIKLSSENNDKLDKIINQSIIFTYDKTIGDTSIENILEENRNEKIFNSDKYKSILKIRNNSFIFIKILDYIIIKDEEEISKYKKNSRFIINHLYIIYQNLDNEVIDKYFFLKFNKIFQDYNTEKSIFIIRIIIGILYEISNIDLSEQNIFIEILNQTLEHYENNGYFDNISYNVTDISKKKIFLEFKENIYRLIS
tara:strand:- start:126 stop:989 length:864 start_codon:yes stop_codon:yes gene_type:complete